MERLFTGSAKDEEVASIENIQTCWVTVTVSICVLFALEVVAYFLYLNVVSLLYPISFIMLSSKLNIT